MSREQGPRGVGMRPSANAASRRRDGSSLLMVVMEAAV